MPLLAASPQAKLPDQGTARVIIIGAGLTGIATAIHLADAGLQVTCLDPVTKFERMVGESLDWSAPELFQDLGLSMEELVQQGISTYKRKVILKLQDQSFVEYIPSEWLGQPPFNIELRTLHLDRPALHQRLLQMAAERGVKLVADKAVGIERDGRRILAVSTASGATYQADWFVDASGSASSFLARELKLTAVEYGQRKVAMWSYFEAPSWQEGTTLYAAAAPKQYMQWVWEIPVRPGTVSIGCVTTGSFVKEQRALGLSTATIFQRQLHKSGLFEQRANAGEPAKPYTTTFTCRTYEGACGPNWFLAGEAASVPDPITGNGVTAALRHAKEASRLILKFNKRRSISRWAQATYNLRLFQMGIFFNSLIEKLAYEWPIRDRLGLLKTGDIYTAIAWSMNHLYSRLSPVGMVSTALFCAALSGLRAMAWTSHQVFRKWSDLSVELAGAPAML